MPITQLANIANIIQSTAASAERVFELLDEQEEEPDGTMEAGRGIRGDVAFESVDFGYKPEVPLMKGLSIEVKSGQTAAIVGPTGAGKTTLVNLLLRFYELDGGRITIDGRDIRQLARGSLRSLFGMVLQDTWLYKGTIRDNIAYGRRRRPTPKSRMRPVRRMRISSSARFRKATRPCSTRTPATCPKGRSS